MLNIINTSTKNVISKVIYNFLCPILKFLDFFEYAEI